jgi:hypothetical protein
MNEADIKFEINESINNNCSDWMPFGAVKNSAFYIGCFDFKIDDSLLIKLYEELMSKHVFGYGGWIKIEDSVNVAFIFVDKVNGEYIVKRDFSNVKNLRLLSEILH